MARPITLPASAAVDDAIAAIIAETRTQWAGNIKGVVAQADIEALHQLRVGLRRFRTALKLFKSAIPKSQRTWLDREARWLLARSSLARDLDVFATELIPALKGRTKQDSFAVLRTQAARARTTAVAGVVRALSSIRFRKFVIRLDVWLDSAGWRTARDQSGSVRATEVVRPAIGKRLRKLRERGAKFDRMSAVERHRLRIAVKKCRYSIEFVRTLLPRAVARDVALALKEVQAGLGHANDVFTAKALVTALSQSRLKAEVAETVARAGRRLIAHHERRDRRAGAKTRRRWHALVRKLARVDLGEKN